MFSDENMVVAKAALSRMYTVFNSVVDGSFGELILLIEYKLRAINDLRHVVFDADFDVLEFETVRVDEFENIINHYRSKSRLGKFRVIWSNLST